VRLFFEDVAMSTRSRRFLARCLCAAALTSAVATPLHAQLYGDGYLFHAPNARVSVRGGYAHANAGGDLFDFATEQLTLSKSDFSGFNAGAELAIPLGQRIDFTVDAGYARANKKSDFRHFIDNNDQPIEQTTTFQRVPLTANLRLNLVSPGRSVGRLAWIPTTLVPWVGAGAGMIWYRFEQEGDFVDYRTTGVFPDHFVSDGWAPALQAMGGVDYSISPLIAVTADGRYVRSRASLGRDFGQFDKIELSGVSATIGLSFRL
jgi:opacity protein-like surface antigen